MCPEAIEYYCDMVHIDRITRFSLMKVIVRYQLLTSNALALNEMVMISSSVHGGEAPVSGA